MEPTDYAKIIRGLKARWWLVVLSVVLTSGIAIFTSVNQKPVYQASSELMLRQKDMSASMLFGNLLGQMGGGPEQSLAAQAKLVVARPMLQEVVDRLKLKIKADELATQVSVVSDVKSNMLSVDVKAPTPYQAQLIANTLVGVYLEKTKEASVNELGRAKDQVHNKVINTEEEIIALAKETGKYRDKVPDDLEAKMEMAVNLYVMMAEKDEQLNIYKELKTSDAQLVSPAVEPEEPISPKPVQNGLLGLAAGLLVGVMVALGLEELDNTLKTTEDAEAAFGLPVIGKIPFDTDMMKGTTPIAVRSGVSSPAAEAFRTIRTNIEFFSAGKPIKGLMVTSANPGEGKSLFSINLAVAFAHTGMKVLLVGCDLRIPTLHTHLGLTNESGLSAYLGGYTDDVDEMVRRTAIENLSMIASGSRPPNPTELLGSERMVGLVAQLYARAELVIFDTPPVLSVADPNVVSRYVDGAVILCDYTQTTTDDGKKASAALANTDVRLLGVVLNKTPVNEPGSYNHYNNHYFSKRNGNERRRREREESPTVV